MSTRTDTDRNPISNWVVLLIGIALGYVVGGSIVGEQKAEGAVQWALSTTSQCETELESEGYSSVTECLELEIWAAEDEIREAKEDAAHAAGR